MIILQRLRDETKELHQQVESSLPVMRPELEMAQYRRLLARFYGFYLPMERDLDAFPPLAGALPDWRERRKTGWLLRDLRGLGSAGTEIASLPCCCTIPSFGTLSESLGCLYVLEGSTLGGQIISRHLAATMGIHADNGGAFFSGYGTQVGPMWKAFQFALSAHVALAEHDVAVSAAKRTFWCLQDWLNGSADL